MTGQLNNWKLVLVLVLALATTKAPADDDQLLLYQQTTDLYRKENQDLRALHLTDVQLIEKLETQRDDAFTKLESANKTSGPLLWVGFGAALGALSVVGFRSLLQK